MRKAPRKQPPPYARVRKCKETPLRLLGVRQKDMREPEKRKKERWGELCKLRRSRLILGSQSMTC